MSSKLQSSPWTIQLWLRHLVRMLTLLWSSSIFSMEVNDLAIPAKPKGSGKNSKGGTCRGCICYVLRIDVFRIPWEGRCGGFRHRVPVCWPGGYPSTVFGYKEQGRRWTPQAYRLPGCKKGWVQKIPLALVGSLLSRAMNLRKFWTGYRRRRKNRKS